MSVDKKMFGIYSCRQEDLLFLCENSIEIWKTPDGKEKRVCITQEANSEEEAKALNSDYLARNPNSLVFEVEHMVRKVFLIKKD